MPYTRVTEEERKLIYRWKQEGKMIAEIALLLGRSKSTISRELERNKGRRGYRPQQAHMKACVRARRPGLRRFTEAVRLDAEEKLGMGWTPDMICERARFEGRPHVSKETISKHVYADAKAGGKLWERLPRASR